MKTQNFIFLPGSGEQVNYLLDNFKLKDKSVLVMGAGSESIAQIIFEASPSSVIMIVDDDESLLKSRLVLAKDNNISVRMMDFDNTDFMDEKFDLVFAQASISNSKRNKIIKEVKRILKPNGYFCVGENTKLKDEAPTFVNDIWNASDIKPLKPEETKQFYTDRNFEIIFEKDISQSLKDFYLKGSSLLKQKLNAMSDEEKVYNKKLIKKISHESNAYLKLGAADYIGFMMLILRKVQN